MNQNEAIDLYLGVELGSLGATLSREARRGTIRRVARGRYAASRDEVAA